MFYNNLKLCKKYIFKIIIIFGIIINKYLTLHILPSIYLYYICQVIKYAYLTTSLEIIKLDFVDI